MADEMDLWERIGQMRWQHIVLIVAAIAGFVALSFAPGLSCSIDSSPAPATTTTTVR